MKYLISHFISWFMTYSFESAVFMTYCIAFDDFIVYLI
jgi:hypothetical protein